MEGLKKCIRMMALIEDVFKNIETWMISDVYRGKETDDTPPSLLCVTLF
jgi:hypothetical protein